MSTPPWVDDKGIDEEEHQLTDSEKDAKIRALKKENAELRKCVKGLEAELQKQKK